MEMMTIRDRLVRCALKEQPESNHSFSHLGLLDMLERNYKYPPRKSDKREWFLFQEAVGLLIIEGFLKVDGHLSGCGQGHAWREGTLFSWSRYA